MPIINLTGKPASPEQRKAGVVDICRSRRPAFIAALRMEKHPNLDEIQARVASLAEIARAELEKARLIAPDKRYALLGGPLFIAVPLARELARHGILPLCSYGDSGEFVPLI